HWRSTVVLALFRPKAGGVPAGSQLSGLMGGMESRLRRSGRNRRQIVAQAYWTGATASVLTIENFTCYRPSRFVLTGFAERVYGERTLTGGERYVERNAAHGCIRLRGDACR